MTKTIFEKISDREIPAQIVHETDQIIAFRDVNPQAPIHILVVPKVPVRDVMATEPELLGLVLEGCKEVARIEGLEARGFRIVINTGKDGGQSVFHLHAHVLGGRPLRWPPG